MLDANLQALSEAIARNCAAVLSLPSAGLLRHQKSRFLSETPAGIWMQINAAEALLVEELIRSRKQAGVSFKNGQTKIVFASPVLEVDRACRINDTTTVPAVCVCFPQQIKAIQRRSAYRVRVFQGGDLSARIWRIAPRAYLGDRPPAAAELEIAFRDLSVGGMGVTFIGESGASPKVTAADRLRIEIRFRDSAILVEGRLRQPAARQQPGTLLTGIAFKDLGGDLEGRQTLSQLTRIIGEMQREEVRRARLGIA